MKIITLSYGNRVQPAAWHVRPAFDPSILAGTKNKGIRRYGVRFSRMQEVVDVGWVVTFRGMYGG